MTVLVWSGLDTDGELDVVVIDVLVPKTPEDQHYYIESTTSQVLNPKRRIHTSSRTRPVDSPCQSQYDGSQDPAPPARRHVKRR